jgi:zinc/manganese transport system permease protein
VTLQLVIPALLAGVLFSGAHAYVGIRLIDRGAIFAGLAITQTAAVGTAVAVLTGCEPQSMATDGWSLGFGVTAAIVLVAIRTHREIAAAILYAVSAAAAVLVLSRAPQDADHIKMMITGDMAAVSLHTLLRIAVVYAIAMVVVARTDALLFAMTAAIASLSVPIAGVLLVFSYLIVPSVAAMFFSRSIGKRLAIAWTMGALVSALGILLSFKIDLPTGATIVCTFGLALLLMAGVWALTRRRSTV